MSKCNSIFLTWPQKISSILTRYYQVWCRGKPGLPQRVFHVCRCHSNCFGRGQNWGSRSIPKHLEGSILSVWCLYISSERWLLGWYFRSTSTCAKKIADTYVSLEVSLWNQWCKWTLKKDKVPSVRYLAWKTGCSVPSRSKKKWNKKRAQTIRISM